MRTLGSWVVELVMIVKTCFIIYLARPRAASRHDPCDVTTDADAPRGIRVHCALVESFAWVRHVLYSCAGKKRDGSATASRPGVPLLPLSSI